MKASEVRILPALDPGESYVEPKFMLVETALDEHEEPITTIEHVASRVVGSKLRWHVTTLGQAVPLSHSAALEWAVSFAASREVPVVYHRDATIGTVYAAAPSGHSSAAASSSAK
jgi:hypothetical protein